MDEKQMKGVEDALEKIDEIMTRLVTQLETLKNEIDEELTNEEAIDEDKIDKIEDTTNQLLAFLENALDELKSIA